MFTLFFSKRFPFKLSQQTKDAPSPHGRWACGQSLELKPKKVMRATPIGSGDGEGPVPELVGSRASFVWDAGVAPFEVKRLDGFGSEGKPLGSLCHFFLGCTSGEMAKWDEGNGKSAVQKPWLMKNNGGLAGRATDSRMTGFGMTLG